MNRSSYFNYIEEKLNILSFRIKSRGRINILDLNIFSETFFAQLFNYLLGYHLENINRIRQNMEGIDLIDRENKILVQVSSICDKKKIENSLSKDILKEYPGFRFKFIAISGEADRLKNQSYSNPYQINFSPKDDIYDVKTLLNLVLDMNIHNQHDLYEFIKEELGGVTDIIKVDTNIAAIIQILSQEDLSEMKDSPEINSFQILRKIEFNNLQTVRSTIDDYKVYYGKLNEKYQEFDRQGVNKSFSILTILRKEYIKLSQKVSEPYDLFYSIIDNVIELIKNSRNYVEIPYEELELCVSILVVDAFIKCKIFENPEGYAHVITR